MTAGIRLAFAVLASSVPLEAVLEYHHRHLGPGHDAAQQLPTCSCLSADPDPSA
jgi:hypothetical protein